MNKYLNMNMKKENYLIKKCKRRNVNIFPVKVTTNIMLAGKVKGFTSLSRSSLYQNRGVTLHPQGFQSATHYLTRGLGWVEKPNSSGIHNGHPYRDYPRSTLTE